MTHVVCLSLARRHHARPYGTCHGTGGGTHPVSWLGSWAPCKALWHSSWHWRWHASRVLSWLVGTKQGPVAHVKCIGLARGHYARPRDTHHGTGGGTSHVSWLDSWAPCKAQWHASRVYAQLVGTMQGPMARIMARVVARVTCLGLAHGHHARPCGTHHGTGSGTYPVSWLDS